MSLHNAPISWVRKSVPDQKHEETEIVDSSTQNQKSQSLRQLVQSPEDTSCCLVLQSTEKRRT